jgi:hypothetical protein
MKTTTTILYHALVLGCFAVLPIAQAVGPDTGGAIPGANTGEGIGVLVSLTSGVWNTGTGFVSLRNNTTGNFNTATGGGAMFFNTTGEQNTATGAGALLSNTTGGSNTANGALALISNTTGAFNTATGDQALLRNTFGDYNTANGYLALTNNIDGPGNTATGAYALAFNSSGEANTATGVAALFINTIGGNNTADGWNALNVNTTGSGNTATGYKALINSTTGDNNTAVGNLALALNSTGSGNIALGAAAGFNLTTGDNNIDIGNVGVAAESDTIRIGTVGTHAATYVAGIFGATVTDGAPVLVDTSGHLGTAVSSARFKNDIKPMDKASEAILALKPVTFHYKTDTKGTPQFGLIAEEVAKVSPALVLPDKEGKPFTVRYEAVNAMLLNEFLKEHCKVEEQQATIAKLKSTVAQQQKGMETFAVQLKDQAAQILKVSAQIELDRPAPRTVLNKP